MIHLTMKLRQKFGLSEKSKSRFNHKIYPEISALLQVLSVTLTLPDYLNRHLLEKKYKKKVLYLILPF